MFSSLVPHAVTRFGFGRTGPKGTPIDIPPVEVHDIETAADKRGRKLKHLLKLNHLNFAVLYHNLQYDNHTPHILGSAYLFGGDADHLNAVYDEMATNEGHEPWPDSPGEIALHDWRDFLGKREYQRAFVDFFEDQLVLHGYDWRAVVEDFMLKGPDPLIHCMISSLAHPLIHLGYAYELNSREVAMEALAMTASCYNDLHKYLDDPKYAAVPSPRDAANSNPVEILARVAADSRLDGAFASPGGNLSRVFSDYEAILLEHWNAWQITGEPAKQFALSQQAAAALLISTAPSIGGHGYDFYLVHLLTSSHGARITIPFLPAQFHLPIIRQWWLITLALYISQLRPAIRFDVVRDTDLAGRDWDWVAHTALTGKHKFDAHFVKACRALREAANTWGDKDEFYLKAAVKFAGEFDGWGGFSADEEEEEHDDDAKAEARTRHGL